MLFNPIDMIVPRSRNEGSARPKSASAFTRATHGTERGRRLVRKAAVMKFGRGKTALEYRLGHWIVYLHNMHGTPVGRFIAVEAYPGVGGSGVDFQPVQATLP